MLITILLALLLACVAIAGVSVWAGGLPGTLGVVGDVFSHFVVIYKMLGVFALATVLLWKPLRTKLNIILSVNIVLLCVALMYPYYLGSRQTRNAAQDLPPDTPTISILSANVWGPRNAGPDKLVTVINKLKPDVLILSEYAGPWPAAFKQTEAAKAYSYVLDGQDQIAVFSKAPIKAHRYFYAGTTKRHQHANTVTLETMLNVAEGKTLTLWSTHTAVPLLEGYPMQKRHFKQWASTPPLNSHAQLAQTHFVIAGDMNATPWSSNVRQLFKQTGLRDSMLGFGIQPSWPILLPVLPIDHVFVNSNIKVLERRLVADIGSDHRPVYIKLAIKPISSRLETQPAAQTD